METQNQHPDLAALAAPFAAADVEWKPGATTRDKKKGLAMAYLTSRAIQDRLDEVCGPAGWRNEFTPGPAGGVLCGISVRVTYADGTAAWVTKWDGADNTDVEAVKGGLSSAMKRAAVLWGIGRYLYGLDAQWVELDAKGRFAQPPRLPASCLPAGAPPQRPQRQRPPQEARQPVNGQQRPPQAPPPPEEPVGEEPKPYPERLVDLGSYLDGADEADLAKAAAVVKAWPQPFKRKGTDLITGRRAILEGRRPATSAQ